MRTAEKYAELAEEEMRRAGEMHHEHADRAVARARVYAVLALAAASNHEPRPDVARPEWRGGPR